MADYIKKIRTSNGDKQIDYEALANLPTIPLVDMSLTNEGAAADAKATGDAINLVNTRVEEKVENPLTGVVGQILEIETVDESGKPKTYKAVNKPSGGGEVTDEQISNAVDNYMTAHPFTETDPTVPDWAKHPEKPRYTAEEVGADASGTAESKVSEHNVSDTAHNDIRLLIDGLTTRLNALADSDDTTLDQMSEVVAYIKSNKSLIDAITTSKVNVSDIIDNLTTNASNKPLSAAQGVALKTMIDGITIPTTLPNPNALTFTGVATGSYDGSSPIEINIPGGGGTDVAVDTTLSVAGQAADAKATGDAISELSSQIADQQNDINEKATTVYVDEEIAEVKAQIVQQTPLFANSIKECTDTSKVYVLPDGYVYGYMYKDGAIYTNLFNSETAKVGYRFNTSGSETSAEGYIISDYIPIDLNGIDTIIARYKNAKLSSYTGVDCGPNCKILYYDSTKTLKKVTYGYVDYLTNNGVNLIHTDSNGDEYVKLGYCMNGTDETTYARFDGADSCKYIRVGFYIGTGDISDVIFTLDEPIENEKIYKWANTEQKFIPSTDEILSKLTDQIGIPIYGTVDEDNNITVSGNLPSGTYTMKYEDESGNATDIGSFTV